MSDLVSATLTTIAKAINAVRQGLAYTSDNSLSDLAKLTRVEPLTIVSRDILSADIANDAMSILLNIFSGYYLQAVNILTNVRDVEVIKVLDRMNPDRDYTGWMLSQESASGKHILATESADFALPGRTRLFHEAKDPTEVVQETSNLAQGKMLNVEIVVSKPDAEKVVTRTVPITVRLAVMPVGTESMKTILARHANDTSLTERFHSWRGGSISFWRDLVFCQDMIDEYRQALHSDPSGAAAEVARRQAMAKKVGAVTKNPSLAVASSIYVMSSEAAREVEKKIGGKLSKGDIRSRVFAETCGMIMCIIDRDYERVRIYVRGIEQGVDLSFSQLKREVGKGGGKGPDVADILKSMNQGMAPSF